VKNVKKIQHFAHISKQQFAGLKINVSD